MEVNKESNPGFTLVELLLVITIIGILASVIFMGMGSTRQRSKAVSALETQSGVMGLAIDCYLKKGGITPFSGDHNGGGSICSGADAWPKINDSCRYEVISTSNNKAWRINCSDGKYIINCDVEKGNCTCENC